MNDSVVLEAYTGAWDAGDPDANFKAEVAQYTRQDPWPTIQQLATNTGIPAGALVRYVLVKWTAEGSEALLAMGPRLVERMWAVTEAAEANDSDGARLEAYATLRAMVSWLRVPLSD